MGDRAYQTEIISEALVGEKVNVKVPIQGFTSTEAVIVKVYDDCARGICSCDYSLQGERLQLKPCRFAHLVPLGTAECIKEGL